MSDGLERQDEVKRLEARVASLEMLVNAAYRDAKQAAGPFKPVFLAGAHPDTEDEGTWKEKGLIVNGDDEIEVADVPGGRGTDDGESTHKMLDLADLEEGDGAYVVLEVLAAVDGKLTRRYVKILGSTGFVLVNLAQTGGAQGDATTAPTWTYTVTRNGEELATGASPLRPRPFGFFTAATQGVGTFEGGSFVLVEAWETEGAEECP